MNDERQDNEFVPNRGKRQAGDKQRTGRRLACWLSQSRMKNRYSSPKRPYSMRAKSEFGLLMANARARLMVCSSMSRSRMSLLSSSRITNTASETGLSFHSLRISRAPLSPRDLKAETMLPINVVSMVRRWLNWFSAKVFCTSQNEKLATKIAQMITAQNVANIR